MKLSFLICIRFQSENHSDWGQNGQNCYDPARTPYGSACQDHLGRSQGKTTQQIATELRTRTARANRWRARFARHGKEGLRDDPVRGKTETRHDATTERRILAVLDENPTHGLEHMDGWLVGKRLGDVRRIKSGVC
jgi:hypothetical protein